MHMTTSVLTILLLLSTTVAAHETSHAPPTTATQTSSLAARKSTRTVFLTLTTTVLAPVPTTPRRRPKPPAPHTRLKPPTFQTQTRTLLTVMCPRPTEPCIMDGIAIWPSSGVPSFTLNTSTSAAPILYAPSKAPPTPSSPKPKPNPSSTTSGQAHTSTAHPIASTSGFSFPAKLAYTPHASAQPGSTTPAPSLLPTAHARMLDQSTRTSTWGNSTTSLWLDPIAWAGRDEKARRDEENEARRRRAVFWGA